MALLPLENSAFQDDPLKKAGRVGDLLWSGLTAGVWDDLKQRKDNPGRTLAEAGTAVALTAGLTALQSTCPEVRLVPAVAGVLNLAFFGNILQGGRQTCALARDAWNSPEHFQQDKQQAKSLIGGFTVDTAVSFGASGLTHLGLKAFTPGKALPSYSDLKRTLSKEGLTAADILAAEKPANYINRGFHHEVFDIPGLSKYVLRVPIESATLKSAKPLLEQVNDPAPGQNFGQAVARIGPAEVLKKVEGEPVGVTVRFGKSKQEISDAHASSVRLAADMPQEAFDDLARKLKVAEGKRLWFDRVNSNNILRDSKAQQFNPVDLDSPLDRRVSHSVNDMILPMAKEEEGLPPPTGWEPAEGMHRPEAPGFLRYLGEPSPLAAEYKQIIDKSVTAAGRAGLTVEDSDELYDVFRNAGLSSKYYQRVLQDLSKSHSPGARFLFRTA